MGRGASMNELNIDCLIKYRQIIAAIIFIVPLYVDLGKEKYAKKGLQFGIKIVEKCGEIWILPHKTACHSADRRFCAHLPGDLALVAFYDSAAAEGGHQANQFIYLRLEPLADVGLANHGPAL